MLTIAQKTIFFHSLESSFDLQSNKKIGVGHQPNPLMSSFSKVVRGTTVAMAELGNIRKKPVKKVKVKVRMEIHSEPIRNFPNHSGISIRTKQFHSNLIRRNFSIRINARPPFKINPNL